MRDFKLIATLLLFSLFITGCMSREERFYRDKALKIIKKDLVNMMVHIDSNQPIKTKMSMVNLDNLGDTLIQNLTVAIRDADSVIHERCEEERKAFRIYRSFGDSDGSYKINAGNNWSRASSAVNRASQERQNLVDSLSSLVKEKGQNNHKLGRRVNLVFHRKGNENYSEEYYTYYLDKECSKILLKVYGEGNQTLYMEDGDFYWSDDYVEIANRIYEETLE